jgi:type I restriction enzyme, S subunit
MFALRHQLSQANIVLTNNRNALLPRLISGKLAVDALDIRFPLGFEDFNAPN